MTKSNPGCCVQNRADDPSPAARPAAAVCRIEPSRTVVPRRWSPPIGGTFLMGSDDIRFPDDGEGPVRQVTISEFSIACFAVSNLQFGDFVRSTGYSTDA